MTPRLAPQAAYRPPSRGDYNGPMPARPPLPGEPAKGGETWSDVDSGEMDRVYVDGVLAPLAFKAREGAKGWVLTYLDMPQRPPEVGGRQGGGCQKAAGETCSAIPLVATELGTDGKPRAKVRTLRGVVRVERRACRTNTPPPRRVGDKPRPPGF